MYNVLLGSRNVRLGFFVNIKTNYANDTRQDRQRRIRKAKDHEFKQSIMSQGIGYSYDFRNVKRYKPKRVYFG